jgi:hypothetical protein
VRRMSCYMSNRNEMAVFIRANPVCPFNTAETIVPMCQVCAATTGHCQIRRIKALIPSDRRGKKFGNGFWDCWRGRA